MASGKCLIVGLGNPGREYDGTRHNVGFEVADRLAAQVGAPFKTFKRGGEALVGTGRLRGRSVVVAKPLTYMNRSGFAVTGLMSFYGLDAEDVLIVYDDLNLELGTVRLRPKGSAGGHNGLSHVIAQLGTDAVPRLRIGIGSDFRRGQQVDYVLSKFSADERPLADEAVVRAAEACGAFVADGLDAAMNTFNR